jgi:hypothetical protein
MSDLRTLPPGVEKVWITVDHRVFSVVIKVLKAGFLKGEKGFGDESYFYTQLQLVYPHLFNSATRL